MMVHIYFKDRLGGTLSEIRYNRLQPKATTLAKLVRVELDSLAAIGYLKSDVYVMMGAVNYTPLLLKPTDKQTVATKDVLQFFENRVKKR